MGEKENEMSPPRSLFVLVAFVVVAHVVAPGATAQTADSAPTPTTAVSAGSSGGESAPTDGSAKPWPQEPNGFHGVAFGSSVGDAKTVVPEATWSSNGRMGIVSLALGKVQLTAGLTFNNSGFFKARMVFSNEDYEAVKEAAITMYGPPHGVEHSEIQNPEGETCQQETLTWHGNVASVVLSRCGDQVDVGVLVVSRATPEPSARDAEAGKRTAPGHP
jgi:hypothetical protein